MSKEQQCTLFDSDKTRRQGSFGSNYGDRIPIPAVGGETPTRFSATNWICCNSVLPDALFVAVSVR
jgi:hypothetical protein